MLSSMRLGSRHGPADRVPMPSLTYRPVPLALGYGGLAGARSGAAERGDDVASVGLELRLFVAVHEVEVELVDTGVGELAELGDLLVGAAQDAEPVGHLVTHER